jgi:hypothetical protein
LIYIRKLRFSSAVEEISGWAAPCGKPLSSTGTFPLRFYSPIQKACWLNQEDTKVKTSARTETPAEKESGKILPDVRGRAEGFLRGRRRSRRYSKNNTEL